jgi:hypothetical protein
MRSTHCISRQAKYDFLCLAYSVFLTGIICEDREPMKLAVGQIAPDFTIVATYDRTVTLSQYRGKNVVLVFFPQAWTPI